MEDEVLEKILNAISEILLSHLLKNGFSYKTIDFKTGKYQQHPQEGAVRAIRNLRLKVKIDNDDYSTDGFHKFDCIVEHEQQYFAVEMKSGQTGPAESLTNFANYCQKKKIRYHESKKKCLNGVMSSFTARLTDLDPQDGIPIVGFSEGDDFITIMPTWYLCFRGTRPIPEPHHHLFNVFQNCRLLFLNELIREQHEDLQAFRETMLEILPLDIHGHVADYIWRVVVIPGQPA